MAYINREQVLNKIDEVVRKAPGERVSFSVDGLKFLINSLPSADVIEQKHGHWIKLDEDDYGDTYKCSNCNTCFYGVVDPNDSLCNFCLTCGAEMDEV